MKVLVRGALMLVLALGRLNAQGVADVRSRLEGRVPDAVVAAVVEAAQRAAAAGLPIEPLVQKALEGSAKGIPAERVIAAVEGLVARLATAADAFRQAGVPAPEGTAIEAGAFALTAGLTPELTRDLVQLSVPPYSPAASLRIAGTMTALGVPADDAVALIAANIRAGRPMSELVGLPGSVQQRMARGATPAQAARGLTRTTGAARPDPQPATPVRPADRPARRPARP